MYHHTHNIQQELSSKERQRRLLLCAGANKASKHLLESGAGMLKRGVMKFIDREPVAAVSLAIGIFGFSLPIIVPPIRQSMGLATNQVRSVKDYGSRA